MGVTQNATPTSVFIRIPLCSAGVGYIPSTKTWLTPPCAWRGIPHPPQRLLLDLPPEDYQAVLIDTGKGLDPLAINALAAADEVIVMVSPGKLELDAIARMQEHVRLVRDEVLLKSEVPQVKGILLTLADHYSITHDLDAHPARISQPFVYHPDP